jgi:hypothetical protein
MLLDRLFSLKNLELAWRRITTGTNHQYKRFFRPLFYAYEIAIKDNLNDLQKRLEGGSYQVSSPVRIYIPKPSGLQRPITLLTLEDQIVWQAVANIFAEKLGNRRKNVELRSVYSNILNNDKKSIFFVKNWHFSYGLLQAKIKEYFNTEFRWIAHFDLAAFYDTICHDLLMKTAFPKGGEQSFSKKVNDWLQTWSSDKLAGLHRHGIPQGPVSSDFMGECFLLPIDEMLSGKFKYLRYVDDIRLFASSETEVQKAAIRLEVLCRERGLIPQGKKYVITKAKSLEEAMGTLPSIAPSESSDSNKTYFFSAKDAVRLFRKGLGGKPQRIADKSRIRYVLYNTEPSPEILKYVIKLLPHHPEQIDAFSSYFDHYKRSLKIVEACKTYLKKSPYEYVQGELWHILARMMNASEMKLFVRKAVNIARDKKSSFVLKWGTCDFLCRAESIGLGKYSRFIQYQESALLQSSLVPIIPDDGYVKDDVISKLLRRTSYEPGIMLAEQLVKRKLTHKNYGLRSTQLPSQVVNTYRALGIIRTPKFKIDPMGEILAERYKIENWQGWQKLFQTDYVHALQIVKWGEALFNSGPSDWLKYQNSFNDALFRAFQRFLDANGLPGIVKLIKQNGKIIDFGALLDIKNQFSCNYPRIADSFRVCNKRRNNLPGSHPYNVKGKKTEWLEKGEQRKLLKELKLAYEDIVQIVTNPPNPRTP